MSCIIENCSNTKMRTKTLCNTHYFRIRRYNSPKLPQTKREKLITEEKSYCGKCKEIKSLSEFYKNKSHPLGISHYCITCSKQSQQEKYKKYGRSKILRNNEYQKKYNITTEKYEEMLKNQNFCCAICNKKPNKKLLCVDHNHSTNNVRGLLCDKCNRGIGLLQDNVNVLANAIKYLLQHTSST